MRATMVLPARCTGLVISRAIAPSSRTAISSRALSTTTALRAFKPKNDGTGNPEKAPIRRNPLIGNYVPARPAQAQPAPDQIPSASTEKPGATSLPNPDKAPMSSAEVAPNVDLPPPPPPSEAAMRAYEQAELAGKRAEIQASKSTEEHLRDKAAAATNGNTASSGKPQTPNTPFNIDIASIIAAKSPHSASSLLTGSNGGLSTGDPQRQVKVRSSASRGRVVHISSEGYGADKAPSIGTALKKLNRLLLSQKLQRKVRYQKYHERKGLKKKRLRVERWKTRFKGGFKAAVQRVNELKRQGW